MFFFFSSRRRHTRCLSDWSSDVCSSDLALLPLYIFEPRYRKMLADALKSHRMFTVAMQRPGQNREAPCPVAGLGLIRRSEERRVGKECGARWARGADENRNVRTRAERAT